MSRTHLTVNCRAATSANLCATASPFVAVELSMCAFSLSVPSGQLEIRAAADASKGALSFFLPPDAARDLARQILAATDPADATEPTPAEAA